MSQPTTFHELDDLVSTLPSGERVTVAHFEVIPPTTKPEEPPKEEVVTTKKHPFVGLLLWMGGLLSFAVYIHAASAWPDPVLSLTSGRLVSGVVLGVTGFCTFVCVFLLILRYCPDRYTDGSWETPETKKNLEGIRRTPGEALKRYSWKDRTRALNRYRIKAFFYALFVLAVGGVQTLLGYLDGRMVEEIRGLIWFCVPVTLLGMGGVLTIGVFSLVMRAALFRRV